MSSKEEHPVTVAKAVDVLSWRMVPKLINLLDASMSFFEAPEAFPLAARAMHFVETMFIISLGQDNG